MRSDSWSSSDDCSSSQRGNAQTPYNARRYTFTLGVDAEVTIDLSSSLDTYLYLLEGHGTEGDVRAYNDDAGSRTLDSRLKLDLKSGEYTIEATTLIYRKEGSFTLKVATDIVGSVPVKVTGLAERYDATVGELFSAGFSYEPDEAKVSVESVEPSGLTLALSARSDRVLAGSAGFAGTPKLAGSYTVTLAFAQSGRTDTKQFIIDASCTVGHVQQDNRNCEPTPVCTIPLGRVSSGTLGPRSGTLERNCVLPAGRRSGSSTFYAKHYTFSLNLAAEVTIDLESEDQDTYMFLLNGHGPNGTRVTEDNDGGRGNGGLNSSLTNLPLKAGEYTITASTYRSMSTGDFTVTLKALAPASVDLKPSYKVIVGQRKLVAFKISPVGIAIPKFGPITISGLDIGVKHANYVELDVEPSLIFEASHAGKWDLELLLIQPGRLDRVRFTVIAECPAGDSVSPDGTCTAKGLRPAIASNCIEDLVTSSRPRWGKVEDANKWAARCPSIQSPSSAAKYYRVGISTPGRFAGGTLPVIFDLSSDPAASIYVYVGSTPATARLLRFGSSLERDIKLGNTYGLPSGAYIVEVATSGAYVDSDANTFNIAVQLPTGSAQLRDVRQVGNIGGNGASLSEFLKIHPSWVFGAGIPYLNWVTDGCDGHQYRKPDTNGYPYGYSHRLLRFESACMRHDFNWSNLQRIERQVDTRLDSWNVTSKRESDQRLHDDLDDVCEAAVARYVIGRVNITNALRIQTEEYRKCYVEVLLIVSLVSTIASSRNG